MKEIVQQLAVYNKWANDRIIETIATLPEELIDQPVRSSFNSIRLTILHLWESENIWWQRLNLAENAVSPVQNSNMPIGIILREWKNQTLQLQEWVLNAKDINLNHVFAYRNSKKEQFKQPVYQVLLHLFNHTTYHRGQIITILHQLGVDKKPATDFILWSRSVK